MRTFAIQLVFPLCLLISSPGQAGETGAEALPWQAPTWDRDQAVQAAARVDSFAESDRLLKLTSQAPGAATLQAINRLTSRPDWPAPAIEAALLRFTNQLRQFPPFSVEPDVVNYLQSYTNRTLVAHPESPEMGIPLYQIRSAATGLVHHWTRLQAARDAAVLISDDPAQLLSVYAESSDVNIRAGIKYAVGNADETGLTALLDQGLQLLPGAPQLTGLLGKSAILRRDSRAVTAVLINGRGHSLTEIARLASSYLAEEEFADLLSAVISGAPAATAALLIAELTPQYISREDISSILMSTLENPELGSAAAMVLAQWGSDAQREALRQLAAGDIHNLTAKRAQSALSLTRPGTSGDLQQ